MNPTKKWMTYGIMLALVAWGVYLAIGATGMFVQKDMMDVRKSGIVIASVALFLGLWAIVLLGTKSKAAATQSESNIVSPARPLSRPGIASLAFAVSGALLWGIAIATWQWEQISLGATTVIGWGAAFCVLAAATAGMIALSSKRVQRGKWFGALGLIGVAVAFIVFVMRMTP